MTTPVDISEAMMERMASSMEHNFRPDYAAAIRALRSALTAAGWQPAATAPKDGTRFQAWLTNSAGFGFWDADCRYNQKTGAFESYGRIDYDQDGWEVWCDGFTHWMPQPGEPK